MLIKEIIFLMCFFFFCSFQAQTSTVAGTVQSTTANSEDPDLFDVTWMSSTPVTIDGYYSYRIIVTTVTSSDPITGSFTISEFAKMHNMYKTLFVFIEAKRPSHQLFSHVGSYPTHPVFNQYLRELMCFA